MKPKSKKIVLLAFTGLLFLASVVVSGGRLMIWSKTAWAGMVVNDEKTVSKIFRGGPADKAGIQVGDSVIAISGISIDDTIRFQNLVSRIQVGDTLVYQVRRNEQELSFSLALEIPFKATEVIISLVTKVLVGLTYLVIGIFVFSKKPKDSRAFIFCLMSVIAAASFFLLAPQQMTTLGFEVARFLIILNSVIWTLQQGMAYLLLPSLFLHFALVFPQERPVVKKHPNIIKWIYGLSILAMPFLAFAVKKEFAIDVSDDLFVMAAIIGFVPMFAVTLLYPCASCVALFRSYRESGVEEKQQVRWPLWALFIAVFGIFIIPAAPDLMTGFLAGFSQGRGEPVKREPVIPDSIGWIIDAISTGLSLLIPISFAFAILKYRLMDIDLIIKKTIVYAILTGIIVALYLSLVGGLGGLLIKFTGVQSMWITIFSTLTIAALFVPVRNRVQNVVDRRFFRKKYDYPTALKNLTRELSQVVELQAMLKLVAEYLQPALQNRSVVIFTRGTYDRAYVATTKVGLPDEILGQLKFEVGSSLLTMMDSPFEVHTKDFPETEKLTLRKAGSAFIVPIKLKNELVGFISLGTKLSDEDYDAEDKDFLTSVAEQMALGIDRVRLREQERDFEKAREIQKGLLPKQIPQLSGYEIACAWQPARAVAGDYYDVIKLSESALGICIADVVGKGMPAALLMSNLQAIVRAMASEDMPPKQLCEKVNRVISSNMTPGKFITFFYCLLDAQNKKLVYTNAGHNRPILFHRDGSWLELKEGGLALGMSRERNYEQGEIELNSGDRLLLFTDGVTEVVNAEREEFGEQRLIDLLGKNLQLRAAELQKKIMEAVTAFSGGDFQDDVTLIAISVE